MKRGVAVLAALAATAAPATVHAADNPATTPAYRILANPSGGDDFLFRNSIQQNAQGISDHIFAALRNILGGTAPTLNFVITGSPLLSSDSHASANVADYPGGPAGTINLDPQAVAALTDYSLGHSHDGAVYTLPHEMMHLRQTAAVLANLAQREGGAQAFADIVTPIAAYRAHVPLVAGNYDGNYAPYVQQAQQQGRDWILGGQMGKPPVQFP